MNHKRIVPIIFNSLIVRGEGYPRQMFQATRRKYASHSGYLLKQNGLDIDTIVNTLEWLFFRIQEKMNEYADQILLLFKESMQIYEEWKEGYTLSAL